jgi:hypothetical protein
VPGFCVQLFDAPPLVRHALNNVCGLDTTYVMSVHDLDKARAMMEQQKGVRKVYSPEVRGFDREDGVCGGGG